MSEDTRTDCKKGTVVQSPGSGRVFKDPLLIRGGVGVDARSSATSPSYRRLLALDVAMTLRRRPNLAYLALPRARESPKDSG